MKVPYREDLASHSGPEPHGGCGNTTADAWVGGSAGMFHGNDEQEKQSANGGSGVGGEGRD